MTTFNFFLIFIPILGILLIMINFATAQHKPYKDKDAQFECGFISFIQMSRMAFTISFFIYALLFLLFDLEILLVYPYVISSYNNDIYGLIVMLLFFLLLTIGFIYELGTKALQIDSRQNKPHAFLKKSLQSSPSVDLVQLITQIDLNTTVVHDTISQLNNILELHKAKIVTEPNGNEQYVFYKHIQDNVFFETIKKIDEVRDTIKTQYGQLGNLYNKGLELENTIKATDPYYKSQLTERINEYKNLKEFKNPS
jgi:NADH-ubiquinone oxidoreductase chain 3